VIFTEVRFLLFVVACWVTLFAVPLRFRAAVLAAWGVAFYAVYAAPFLPLVVELVVASYLIGRGRGDLALIGAVVILFIQFKSGFDLTGLAAAQASRTGPSAVLVPLGFSFLAFELMHLVIECRRGRIQSPRLLDVASFAFFFPCRIAGPIKRYPAYLAAVADARPSIDNVYAGLVRVLVGILKKVAIADLLGLTAFEISYAATPLHVWRVVLAYGVQIYVDFSAYSDIAIGVSRILGITVPENFNWPYLSPNIQEFWNRWHMTLSGWARDYIFSPAGRALFKTSLKSRPAVIAAVSYLATFLVIGAWHGIAANFLVWGAYHGVLLSAYYVYRTRIPATIASSSWFHSRPVTVIGAVVTFFFVTIGWFPFMTDLPGAMRLLRIAAGGH
jgi:alginate O-acetyltransferase complex protein AlgI